MTLNIVILKEQDKGECRVAGVPESVKKLISVGCSVSVEKGAGALANYSDEDYKVVGAKVITTANTALKSADVLLCVNTPKENTIKSLKKGALIVGSLDPHYNKDMMDKMAKAGVTGFAMELMPRISRAQSMDILSSQSNLTGYKAVLDAAEYFKGSFPLMMTAAGTVPPAKVFIMGVGVAGLQAVATAKRLGAIVSATDVRPVAKEQVESLGGKFIAVENEEFEAAETAGGYAKEMSKSYQKEQAELIKETIAKQDIVITTALIPGREAPELVTEDMVKSMKAGSIIVDLAVERGGNCAVSELGKVVEKHGVFVIGHSNVPSRLASIASDLFSRNLLNFMNLIIDEKKKGIVIDWSDEIIQGVALTKDGKVTHPLFKAVEKKKTPAKKTPAKKATVKKVTKKTVSKKVTKKATKTKTKKTTK